MAGGMLIGASPVIIFSAFAFGSLVPQHVLVQASPNTMWGDRLSYSASRIIDDAYTMSLRTSPKWYGIVLAVAFGMAWWSLRYRRNAIAVACSLAIALLTTLLITFTHEWPGMPPMVTGFFVSVPLSVVALNRLASVDASTKRIQRFVAVLLVASMVGLILNPSGIAYGLVPGGRYVLAFVPLVVSIAMLGVARWLRDPSSAGLYSVTATSLVATGLLIQVVTIAGISGAWHKTLGQLREMVLANTQQDEIIVTTRMEYPSMLGTTYLDRQWYYERPQGSSIHGLICQPDADYVWYLGNAQDIPSRMVTAASGGAQAGTVLLANGELVVLEKRAC